MIKKLNYTLAHGVKLAFCKENAHLRRQFRFGRAEMAVKVLWALLKNRSQIFLQRNFTCHHTFVITMTHSHCHKCGMKKDYHDSHNYIFNINKDRNLIYYHYFYKIKLPALRFYRAYVKNSIYPQSTFWFQLKNRKKQSLPEFLCGWFKTYKYRG